VGPRADLNAVVGNKNPVYKFFKFDKFLLEYFSEHSEEIET